MCPEVFTKENKKWYFAKGQSRPNEKNGRSILTKEDVIDIRLRKEKGENKKDVFKSYENRGITLSGGFSSIWSGKTWKNI